MSPDLPPTLTTAASVDCQRWRERRDRYRPAGEVIDLLGDPAVQPTDAEADALMRGLKRLYASAELVRVLFGDLPPTGEVQ